MPYVPVAVVNQTAGAGTAELLALKVYAPAAQTIFTSSSATLADVDATNAAVTFTAPASGNVLVRVSAWIDYVAPGNDCYVDLREASSDISGTVTRVARDNTSDDFEQYLSVPMYVSGVSAGSHTFKLGFAATQSGAAAVFRIIVQDGSGTGVASKWGPLIMEVWSAP